MSNEVKKRGLENEEWRPIVGHERDYAVSSIGRVRRESVGRGTKPGRLLSTFIGQTGYVRVLLTNGAGRRTHYQVHRLVLAAFDCPSPTGMEVNHKNGIKADNRIENLEWVTRSENMRHSIDHLGAQRASGESNGMAKLKADDVRSIRETFALGGATKADLARRFGVDLSLVWQILKRRIWCHVP